MQTRIGRLDLFGDAIGTLQQDVEYPSNLYFSEEVTGKEVKSHDVKRRRLSGSGAAV
jgi:hypothetical protein